MMDDLKHYAKYAGMWLTTRGVLTLAVLAATAGFGIGGYYMPLLTLPLGLGAAVYMHRDQTEYLRTRVKNAYKMEIAATLGKNPKEVTVPDLELVAKGDAEAGLPGNRILKEQLNAITTHHQVSLLSNIGAVGIAATLFSIVTLGGFEGIIESWQHLLQPLIDILPIHNPQVFAAGTLAGGIAFASDYTLSHLGEKFTGLNERTTYDAIQELKKERRYGKKIAPEQVLEIFVRSDDQLAQRIFEDYGNSYQNLPPQMQSTILEGVEQKSLILALTDKINEGRISANELSFLAQGQHSGVTERQPKTQHALPLFLPEILVDTLQPEREKKTGKEEKPPVQTVITVSETPQGTKVEQSSRTHSEHTTPDGSIRRSFVERYVAQVDGEKEAKNFVEKLMQENTSQQQGATGVER